MERPIHPNLLNILQQTYRTAIPLIVFFAGIIFLGHWGFGLVAGYMLVVVLAEMKYFGLTHHQTRTSLGGLVFITFLWMIILALSAS